MAAVKIIEQYGGLRNAAHKSSHSLGWLQHRHREAKRRGLAGNLRKPEHPGQASKVEKKGRRMPGAHKEGKPAGRIRVPKKKKIAKTGAVQRFILTCQQSNTDVHPAVWRNVLALAEYYDAHILVSQFTYSKASYGRRSVKPGTRRASDVEDVWFAPECTPYVANEPIQLAPGLVWCGELNILPTAVRPLSGLDNYTGRQSGIVPHVKFAMESVPSGKNSPTKFMYTTGTVTLRNYVAKKEGQKASFHHGYGGLLVEVDDEGNWFVRQLNADSGGVIHDLDVVAKNGEVAPHKGVEAVLWGDIHVEEIDEGAADVAFSPDGMLDVLRPRYQFMGDVLSFRARSHHDRKDPHKMFKRWERGEDNVREAVHDVAHFLKTTRRPDTHTVVVASNHHRHLGRWLQEMDGRLDPVNAEFWIEMSRRIYAAIRDGQEPNYLLHACDAVVGREALAHVTFLDEDDSLVVCPDANGGIEMAHHGDRGPHGARGSANLFARMGRKMCIGHSHVARIVDGVYQVGTMSTLQPEWAPGPNAHSHTHCVIYPNGKRALITFWQGKWRA